MLKLKMKMKSEEWKIGEVTSPKRLVMLQPMTTAVIVKQACVVETTNFVSSSASWKGDRKVILL